MRRSYLLYYGNEPHFRSTSISYNSGYSLSFLSWLLSEWVYWSRYVRPPFLGNIKSDFFLRFFVISGFLIGMILCKYDELNRDAIFNFYHRRFKRIFPLYYLAIILIFSSLYTILTINFYDINIKSGLRAIFLTTNLKIRDNGQDDYDKLVNFLKLFSNLLI